MLKSMPTSGNSTLRMARLDDVRLFDLSLVISNSSFVIVMVCHIRLRESWSGRAWLRQLVASDEILYSTKFIDGL